MASQSLSTKALVGRINRRLRKEGEVLRKSRSERMRQAVGDYYTLDFHLNAVIRHDVDLEDLARELGALD